MNFSTKAGHITIYDDLRNLLSTRMLLHLKEAFSKVTTFLGSP